MSLEIGPPRKMTVRAWHLAAKDQGYAFARPGLVSHKRRKLGPAAGAPIPARQLPAGRRGLQRRTKARPPLNEPNAHTRC
jgi:hypothetical protein